MKKVIKTIIMAIVFTTMSLVNATEETEPKYGVYVGVGMSQTTWNVDGNDTTYKENNYKLLFGKKLDDNIALELQYLNVKNDSVTGSDASAGDTVFGRSIGVSALYYFMPQLQTSPFVKLGYHSWNLEDDSDKINDNDVFYAIGVDGKINETLKYRIEYEQMQFQPSGAINDAVFNNIGAALLFDF